MSSNAKENNYLNPLRKVFVNFLILLLITIFFMQTNLNITASSSETLEWSVTLIFYEKDGANSNVVFGEALDASDGQDSYDTPSPPPSIPPYIRTWFDSDLNEPYNNLFKDIRIYPDESKIWDLYVQWVPSDFTSSSDFTISWSISEISASKYDSVVLFDYDNDIVVADMQLENNYTYTSSAMKPYYFQIICNSTSVSSNHPPYQPSDPYPQNGKIDVNLDTTLAWTGGDPDDGDIITYDVYFGTIPIPPMVSNNQSAVTYDTDILSYSTTYYWQIVAWDNQDLTTEGLIWYFTTKPPPLKNKPPIADLNGPFQGYENQTITFDASKSIDSDGIIEYYRWDFTNDNIWDTEWVEETTQTYVYPIAGNYTVRLQVKDNMGAINTTNSIVTIISIPDDNIIPVAYANGPYLGLINQSILFDASDSYDPDGTINGYLWDFGDETNNSDMISPHVYTTKGAYTVTLIIVDNDGLTDIDKTTAYIFTTDSDGDGWGDDEENRYGTDSNNSLDYPLDTDNDHIPDSEDDNDDNDGLSDKLEEKLGSDPKNMSDVIDISINGIRHFLIDTNKDGKSDIFYNSRSGKTTEVDHNGKNQYLLDEDGDGQWDYLYDHTYGTLSSYQREISSSFSVLPVAILLIILLLLLIFVTRMIYRKS